MKIHWEYLRALSWAVLAFCAVSGQVPSLEQMQGYAEQIENTMQYVDKWYERLENVENQMEKGAAAMEKGVTTMTDTIDRMQAQADAMGTQYDKMQDRYEKIQKQMAGRRKREVASGESGNFFKFLQPREKRQLSNPLGGEGLSGLGSLGEANGKVVMGTFQMYVTDASDAGKVLEMAQPLIKAMSGLTQGAG